MNREAAEAFLSQVVRDELEVRLPVWLAERADLLDEQKRAARLAVLDSLITIAQDPMLAQLPVAPKTTVDESP